MWRFFEISRSAYYAWVARLDQADRDTALLVLIQQAYPHSRQTYGYRRIQIWLPRERGVYLNHKTVLRLMRKLGIQAVVRRDANSIQNLRTGPTSLATQITCSEISKR
jgi:transposase InsO family protein